MPTRTQPESEQQLLREIKNELSLVDQWVERVENARWDVASGSPLAGDDRKSAPFQVSHAATSALLVAVDHAHCLQRSVDGCRVCGPHHLTLLLNSYYSLLRGALENAARVVWLLAPAQRSERILRRLRLQTGNINQSDEACRVGKIDPNAPKEDRLRRVREIAVRAGISADATMKPPTNREIVRTACAYIADAPDHGELLWRICSAASHGDTWAVLSLNDKEEIYRRDDVLTMHTTASTPTVTKMLTEALAVVKEAFLLYDQRNTAYDRSLAV